MEKSLALDFLKISSVNNGKSANEIIKEEFEVVS
jgi:hypothetical protein